MASGNQIAYIHHVSRQTTLERAFDLARTGDYAGIGEIRDALKAEGFTLRQLDGPSLQKQLRKLCADARRAKTP
jgi:hypothetical protein